MILSTVLMRRTEKSWLINSSRKPHSSLKFRCILWILLTDCPWWESRILAHSVVSLRQPQCSFATPLGKKQQGICLQLDCNWVLSKKPPIFLISAPCIWSLVLTDEKPRENLMMVLTRESDAGFYQVWVTYFKYQGGSKGRAWGQRLPNIQR